MKSHCGTKDSGYFFIVIKEQNKSFSDDRGFLLPRFSAR
jgi:hypothetical protein